MPTNRWLNAAYFLQRRLWRLLRPRTRGVKVMVFNADQELALVRNGYGRSDLFVLPGGGVRWFEQPAEAAAREVREELGVDVTNLKLISEHASSAEGKRDRIYLFAARADEPLQIDNFEVQEARFVHMTDLPTNISPATRRRIEEYRGVREADGGW